MEGDPGPMGVGLGEIRGRFGFVEAGFVDVGTGLIAVLYCV